MPVAPNRLSEPGAASRRRPLFLVAGTVFLLGLVAFTHLARGQLPSGACCAPAGGCTLVTQADCDSLSVWHADSTSCTPNPCPQPTGACCALAGACTVGTQAACTGDNEWKGANTPCPAAGCVPIGACCSPFRVCKMTTQDACISPDTWQGPGAKCVPTPCPRLPTLTEYRFFSPDTTQDSAPGPLTRDDTVILRTRWDVPNSPQLADSLWVTADFSRLDPGVLGNHAVPAQWLGTGQYQVTYPLSGTVSRSDSGGIKIPLSATGRTGPTTDARVEVCLSNFPPVHDSTRVVRPKDAPYRSADSLVIETFWRSPGNLPLQITASFAEVDTLGAQRQGSDRGAGVFRIRYRLPLSAEHMPLDGTYPIPITARDAGCGQTTNTTVGIEIDTHPPADLIRVDPMPAVTTDDSVRVSGEAPQSVVVMLVREGTAREIVECDSATSRFSGMLELLPGENRIQVRGEDAAGNSTSLFPASPGAVIVTRVEAARLEVGTPYSRKDKSTGSGDDIVLQNPEPMDMVVVRIFNLEGDCLWQERPAPTGQVLDLRFHWAGTDRAGERAPQGYYLVRAEWRNPRGKARSITKGLLLRD